MTEVIVDISMSLDGYVDAPDGWNDDLGYAAGQAKKPSARCAEIFCSRDPQVRGYGDTRVPIDPTRQIGGASATGTRTRSTPG